MQTSTVSVTLLLKLLLHFLLYVVIWYCNKLIGVTLKDLIQVKFRNEAELNRKSVDKL